MYNRFRPKERRSTAKSDPDPAGFGFDPLSAGRPHGEGKGHMRKHTKALTKALDSAIGNGAPLEENFIGLEFRSSSSKKASRAPIKALLDKEMSKDMENRRSSPSLVARLMGLDTLPPSIDLYQQKERTRRCQKNPSVGFHEKHATYEEGLQTSATEYYECKDVFEVTEKPKAEKHKNQPIPKTMSSLKESEVNMAFIKQEFMDAKYPSTDNAYKELDDVLEVQDSNDDNILNFLREPNPLFKMHLQEPKCSPPSPHASDITILKPSKGTKYESNKICCKSERYTQCGSHMQYGDRRSSRKAETRLVDQSLREHCQSLPCKLSDLQYTGKIKDHLQPTQIVILKPSLEKALGMSKIVPLATSPDNDQCGLRQHKRVPISRDTEYYAEGRERQKLSDSIEVMGHKTGRLNKIAIEINEQMSNTRKSRSKEMPASKIHGYVKDERLYGVSGMGSLNSGLFQSTSDHLNDCSDGLSTSSYYSTESSLCREARKRLSERWKTTHLFQEVRPIGRGSNTLREMLASSDIETPRTALNTSIIQNVSNGKVDRDEVLARWNIPSGISSKDGWKDGWSRNLPRSRSLPASSLFYQNHRARTVNRFGRSDCSYLKHALKKRPVDAAGRELRWRSRRTSSLTDFEYCQNDAQIFCGKEENQMSEREIHVNSEELQDRIHAGHPGHMVSVPEVCNSPLAGQGHVSMVPELCDNSFAGRRQVPGNMLSPEFNHKKSPLVDDWKHIESACLAEDGEFPGHNWNSLVMKETSMDQPQVGSLSPHHDALESIDPISSKEVDQPSPVTVSETISLEENKFCPYNFEKISSDLHDLRLQLKLLKLESADTYTEDMDVLISSEEDNGGDSKFGEILEAFRDDEDRDFSYLLDVLIDSGVQDASQDGLLFACQSLEYAVGPEAFEKLEKKYNMLVSWPRSERKLLFDLIRSILTEVIVPLHNLHSAKPKGQPMCAREDLVEKVWQMVVKRRKDLSAKLGEQLLDPRWLDMGDDVDVLGKSLERLIIGDLVEELCHLLC